MPSGSLALFRAQQARGRCHYLFKSEHRHVPLKPCTWISTCPAYKRYRGAEEWRCGTVAVAENRGWWQMLGGQNQLEIKGKEEVENGRNNGGRYEKGIREICRGWNGGGGQGMWSIKERRGKKETEGMMCEGSRKKGWSWWVTERKRTHAYILKTGAPWEESLAK